MLQIPTHRNLIPEIFFLGRVELIYDQRKFVRMSLLLLDCNFLQ